MTRPSQTEDDISKIPALLLLKNLGYEYLSPEETVSARGGKLKEVLLEDILARQLRKINLVKFKGREYPFSEGNILSAIQSLKDVGMEGVLATNEKLYDLLCLGKSLPQAIEGNTKSFAFRFIDWETPENNVFHVTEEFEVERTASHDTYRPDIVLFVNGIPLVVIECKRPDLANKEPILAAIEQHVRNQQPDSIPKLYYYSQVLMALSKNEAKYATTWTTEKFWSIWKETGSPDFENKVEKAVGIPLTEKETHSLYKSLLREIPAPYSVVKRQVTEQDRALYALCRKERLLELVARFIVFDAGEKKIARYQQYFCVNKILPRLRQPLADGSRTGGVVWHTQGSGKSLTMVMLAKAIALEPHMPDAKIVLVTDRVELDEQIKKVFRNCGMEPSQAKTGTHLAKLLQEDKAQIITTVIDKFEAAVAQPQARNESPDIFVLVDESHRTQYGALHAKMRKTLPKACFIGFTGTPILKDEKNTIDRFGGLIDTYTIAQAVQDKAVVPLLYEGRHVEQKVDREGIDSWFERITADLTHEQQADLKRKFSTSGQLNKAQQKVMRVAWDVSAHFRDHWQSTGAKAQLVTPSKATALLYKTYLDEFGMVSSEVLISPPDDREGETDPYGETDIEIKQFWKKMIAKYGSEKEYNRQISSAFTKSDHPEIVIVVDKLLTGFDAPRNTVLYLTRSLQGHTLLQAIARVNRLSEGKDFGYILDYFGVLENLDEALDVYAKLSEFDDDGLKDLAQTLTEVNAKVKELPQHHSNLWELFKTIQNKKDQEEYERLLADELSRYKFYEKLSAYARSLALALSSVQFMEKTPLTALNRYKGDLKFFMNLRTAVRRRYAEVVDFHEYETKIRKLIDTHVGTGEVEKMTDLVNIFDDEAFAKEVEKLGNPASKADTIAYRTMHTIHERMDEDPAFYRKFSDLLEEAIQAFKLKRMEAVDYLRRIKEIAEKIRRGAGDGVPDQLKTREAARAFFNTLLDKLPNEGTHGNPRISAALEAAQKIDDIIQNEKIVDWERNVDVQNKMKTRIEDCLFEIKQIFKLDLPFETIDIILDEVLDIARHRYPS